MVVDNRLFHDRILPEMSSILATDQHSRDDFKQMWTPVAWFFHD